MLRRFGLLLLPVAALTVACSGGGGSASPPGGTPPPNGQGTIPNITQTITLTLTVPPSTAATGGHLRKPKDNIYVSPATASVVVQLVAVNGTSISGAGVTQPSPVQVTNCSAGCTVPIPNVPAAVGTDTYSVSTYAAPTATGATPLLSSGVVAIVVGPNGPQSTSLNDPTMLTVGGVVAALTPPVVTPAFVAGIPGTSTVTVGALDAAGKTIVNALLANPITLSLPPSEKNFALAGTGLQPNGTISLSATGTTGVALISAGTGTQTTLTATTTDPNGNIITSSTIVTVLASPSPSPSPTPTASPTPTPSPTPSATPTATPSPTPTPAPVIAGVTSLTFANVASPAQSFTVHQNGFAGPFTVTSTTPSVATATVSGTSVIVTPAGVGSTSIIVTGTSNQSATVAVGVGAAPVVAVPASIAFVSQGARQSVTVSQTGFAGPFTIAVVDPTTGAPSTGVVTASIAGTHITVTAVNSGSANIVVTGGFGQSSVIPAGVTLTPGTIQ